MLSSLVLALAPLQATGQLDRVPGAHVADVVPQADCVGDPVVPSFAGELDFSFQGSLIDCSSGSPGPFSGRWTPDGARCYVALFGGGFSASNCRVARLDPLTLQPTSTIPVGLGPQELAFTATQAGALRYGFVTNSTGSSVTVFDASDTVVATIPIPVRPGDPFGTAFPFGMAVAPDGAHVYVGTNDGSGVVHAIDVATLALDPAEELALGAGHGFGRMAVVGDTLVLTATLFHAGFQGSTGKVFFVDLATDVVTERVLVSSPTGTSFPSPVDVAVWCDRVYVAGFDMGTAVYELSVATGELQAVLPTQTTGRMGKLHALGGDGHGLLVVADFITGEVAFLDATRREPLAVFDTGTLPGFHAQLNDVVVEPGGDRIFLTGQGSSTFVVFERP